MFLNSFHIPLFDTHKSFRKRLSNVQVLGPFADWPFDCVELFRIWIFSYCFDVLDFLPTVVWWLVIPSKFSDKFMGTNSDLHQNWLRREAWDWRLPFVWLLLLEFAWGACIVQGPSWWLMNWLHPSSWLKRNGWAHRTHTGTLTCRVTLKVHVFELLSHPAPWHSQVIQKTSIKCTSSWPFCWLTLWLCGIVSHLNIFILLWCVGLFANCGVMTCHTFKVLRQIYGDKFWSAPELTPQRSLRLFLLPLGTVSLLLEVPKCMYPTSTQCEQALMWLWRQPRWHWLPGDLSAFRAVTMLHVRESSMSLDLCCFSPASKSNKKDDSNNLKPV